MNSSTTVEDVMTALEVLASRVPDRHVSPDAGMAAVWHSDLRRWPRAAMFRAAREWTGAKFPSVGQMIEAVQAAARAIVVEEQAALADGTIDLMSCPHGCAHGWIEAEGVSVVRPCERCRPIGHAMWRHRVQPGHDEERCPDCILIAGRSKASPQWLTDARARADRAPGVEREDPVGAL